MSNQIHNSLISPRISFIVILCCFLDHVNAAQPPSAAEALGNSDMGRYQVSNSEQCRRLCWYRKLCTGYRYTDMGQGSSDCSLFDHPLQESSVSSKIQLTTASNKNVHVGCADRPCAETEVCVPATASSQQHRCLPLVADCGVPKPVRNGSFDWSGTRQGSVANLKCDEDFAPFPEGASGQLTCHVTSQWRPVGITCKKLGCENGGVDNGTMCVCPIQYRGRRCERYIRDCTEAFRNGHDNPELSGPFYIQPDSSPAPFQVYCRFEWGGITIPMKRVFPSDTEYDVKWTTAKAGFIYSLTSDLNIADFFVGLENLRHLLSQASYTLHASLSRYDEAYAGYLYDKIELGDESTNYTLTFDKGWPREESITVLAQDGFQASPPITFHTRDRDTNGCTGLRGSAGWYGADCNGYTLFSNGMLVWPAGGVAQNWTVFDAQLERHGDFYGDL